MRTPVLALLAVAVAVAAFGLGACGDDSADTAKTTTAPAAGTTAGAAAATLAISTDLSKKPEIPTPSGEPPTKLVAEDVVVGDGRAATSGDNVVVHYVGVLFSDGEPFDASWDRGRPFDFTLGQGDVIAGWDQGVEGMKVGGRRLLIIPPDLAYGAQGQGTIPPDAPLVFVIDLLNAGPA